MNIEGPHLLPVGVLFLTDGNSMDAFLRKPDNVSVYRLHDQWLVFDPESKSFKPTEDQGYLPIGNPWDTLIIHKRPQSTTANEH